MKRSEALRFIKAEVKKIKETVGSANRLLYISPICPLEKMFYWRYHRPTKTPKNIIEGSSKSLSFFFWICYSLQVHKKVITLINHPDF